MDKNNLKSLLQQPPMDHSTAKRQVCMVSLSCSHGDLYQQALARDGYRCAITGLCDLASYEDSEEVRAMAAKLGITATTVTQAAHIFPPSTHQGITGQNADSSKVLFTFSLSSLVTHTA
jgi:hypothetical protein